MEKTLGAFKKCVPFEKPNGTLFWVCGHFEQQVNILAVCGGSPGGNIRKMQLPICVFHQFSMASEVIMAFQLPRSRGTAKLRCLVQPREGSSPHTHAWFVLVFSFLSVGPGTHSLVQSLMCRKAAKN